MMFLNRNILLALLLLSFFPFIYSQKHTLKIDTIYKDSVPIKILYDNKIYKLNAGFASIGTGFYTSNNIVSVMQSISFNFNFHLWRELYFQIGLNRLKSNASFSYPEKKDINVHYFNFYISPFTIKTENIRYAFVFSPIGIAYGGGYKDETYHLKGALSNDSSVVVQNNYFGVNMYSSISCFFKFKYDIGIGTSVYVEYSQNEILISGISLSVYFNASFRGYQTKPAWYYKKNPTKE